ncbi:hypothetical protein HMPREF0083_00069 [Aneurinibacillus aneurinilyticus ATCC 12856]|uniref:Uncharacterized protein n=1 Tax=Aneurinibacillus aneurinilyticus ATCC 12856 TaxID=649747 RepID=U1XA42_ANEAE|nr:hypothetical protein HMPREF0083_00069 [Aneurinibacillus aneurinilyticus ATCC 12856]
MEEKGGKKVKNCIIFKKVVLSLILAMFVTYSVGLDTYVKAAQPVWMEDVGPIRFVITDVHTGYAGPKFPSNSTPHTNFHIYKKNDKTGRYDTELANYHIVKYSSKSSSTCIYVWDSISKKTIVDICTDSWKNAASAAASAMKNFISEAVDKFVEIGVATWLAIAGAIYSIITKLNPVPRTINTSNEEEQTQQDEDTSPYPYIEMPYLPVVELEE